jgi:hypothetical protein
MNDLAAPAPAPAEAPPAAGEPGRIARWSDRLNPILVREVRQALKARAFPLLVVTVLVGCVGLGLGVTEDVANAHANGRAFSIALAALVPLVLFVVPMQAYQAMRTELRAGIVEQLLLSRLRPMRIVAGKLGAAMVQYFLYLSLLSPLLATTYLLRGIDVPTIAWCLLFSLLFCVATTALAIAAAAQGLVPMLQPLANIGVAFSLGMFTVVMVGAAASGALVRDLQVMMRRPEWSAVASALSIGLLLVTVLAALVAASLLTHGFENRSTPLRLFLVAVAAIAYAWLLLFVPRAYWSEAAFALTMGLLVVGGVFGVFFVTEIERLSPRQRALGRRWPRWSLLTAPLLPGRGRALAFLLAFGAALWVAAELCRAGSGKPRDGERERVLLFLAVYVVIYLSLTKLLRGLLPETLAGSYAARVVLPVLLILCCVVPVLLDTLFAGGVHGWHVGHALDPFYTLEEFGFSRRSSGDDVLVGLGLFAGALLCVQVPSLARAFGEVLALRPAAERSARAE